MPITDEYNSYSDDFEPLIITEDYHKLEPLPITHDHYNHLDHFGEFCECCGSCRHFKHETADGDGWCKKAKSMTDCGDYCGYWKETK
jgi:hypothetical protein